MFTLNNGSAIESKNGNDTIINNGNITVTDSRGNRNYGPISIDGSGIKTIINNGDILQQGTKTANDAIVIEGADQTHITNNTGARIISNSSSSGSKIEAAIQISDMSATDTANITNAGEIRGVDEGIHIGLSGDNYKSSDIINLSTGVIEGTAYSIDTGKGLDNIDNSGSIIGNIFQNEEDDIFLMRLDTATFTGIADGGLGENDKVIFQSNTDQAINTTQYIRYESIHLRGDSEFDLNGAEDSELSNIYLEKNARLLIDDTNITVPIIGDETSNGIRLTGTMTGDIDLGDGDDDDIFILEDSGIVSGTVTGNNGNDIFVVKSHTTPFVFDDTIFNAFEAITLDNSTLTNTTSNSDINASVNLINNSILTPASPMNINGDLNMSSGSTINLIIDTAVNPALDGEEITALNIAGDVKLSGILNITNQVDATANTSLEPSVGETYELIKWNGTRTGHFDTINLPGLPSYLEWNSEYDDASQ